MRAFHFVLKNGIVSTGSINGADPILTSKNSKMVYFLGNLSK